jgi:hypothetical protein
MLISPLEYFLQIPQLLVLRLLLQQAMDIGFEIVPLDEQTRAILPFFCYLLVFAIWISYQMLYNHRIFQVVQVIVALFE